MSILTVLLALSAALANGAASALQRRAAMEHDQGTGAGLRQALRRLLRLARHPFWLAGTGTLLLSGALQAAALATGRLSVVQPLMATELLFTLMVGSLTFHRRPDGRTWLWFMSLAGGLALFLGVAVPFGGQDTAGAGSWLGAGTALAVLVIVLVAAGRTVRGAARAFVLGCATAACFSFTAALVKDVTGRIDGDPAALFTLWQLYALCGVGLLTLLLLASTLRSGTLAASQPALTVGDALVSVALGWALFGERIALGAHVVPEVAGFGLMAVGAVGLSRSPALSGAWDTLPPPAGEAPGGDGRHRVLGGRGGG